MKNFGLILLVFMVLISCSKDDSVEVKDLVTGNLEVTVLLGADAAIGAKVTTVPETKIIIVPASGLVLFSNIKAGGYKVNVVINNNEDFVYYQEVVILEDLDVALLLNNSYKGLQRIFDADSYLAYWGDTGTDILQTNQGVNYSLDELDAYFITPQSNIINQVWTEHYQQIRQVNIGIDYLNNPNKVVANNIDRKVAEAELRFLRGLLYFNLVKIYGNPLLSVTSEIDFNNPPNYPQNSLTTYSQIEEDLLFAIQNLPSSGSNDRANQMSARGLLAKMYMKMAGFPFNETNNYVKALEQLNFIKGQFELEEDYKAVFNIANENSNSEVIFRVAFNGDENSSSAFNQYWGPLGVSDFDALVLVSGLVNSFSDSFISFESPVDFPIILNDQRFYNSIATFTVEGNVVVNSPDPDSWRPLKWYNGNHENADFNSSAFDYPVLRYADILLMLAESENEVNGPNSLAYDAINQVRRRAFGNTEHDVPSNLNQEQFFEKVFLERKLELCFEGHRRDDLIRREQLQNIINEYNAANDFQKDFQSHEYVWPIPQQELDLNPNAIQNSGY